MTTLVNFARRVAESVAISVTGRETIEQLVAALDYSDDVYLDELVRDAVGDPEHNLLAILHRAAAEHETTARAFRRLRRAIMRRMARQPHAPPHDDAPDELGGSDH